MGSEVIFVPWSFNTMRLFDLLFPHWWFCDIPFIISKTDKEADWQERRSFLRSAGEPQLDWGRQCVSGVPFL